MNFVHIAGHLGSDPEVRFTSSGQKVTTLRLAARARRSKEDATIWWRVTIWGEQFDKMMPYLKKGSPLIVIGELNKPEIFTDRNGNPQISMGVTASNLLFSPFGKQERTEGTLQSSQVSQTSQVSQASTSSTPSDVEAAFNSANLGNNIQDTAHNQEFNDDEVPF